MGAAFGICVMCCGGFELRCKRGLNWKVTNRRLAPASHLDAGQPSLQEDMFTPASPWKPFSEEGREGSSGSRAEQQVTHAGLLPPKEGQRDHHASLHLLSD